MDHSTKVMVVVSAVFLAIVTGFGIFVMWEETTPTYERDCTEEEASRIYKECDRFITVENVKHGPHDIMQEKKVHCVGETWRWCLTHGSVKR